MSSSPIRGVPFAIRSVVPSALTLQDLDAIPASILLGALKSAKDGMYASKGGLGSALAERIGNSQEWADYANKLYLKYQLLDNGAHIVPEKRIGMSDYDYYKELYAFGQRFDPAQLAATSSTGHQRLRILVDSKSGKVVGVDAPRGVMLVGVNYDALTHSQLVSSSSQGGVKPNTMQIVYYNVPTGAHKCTSRRRFSGRQGPRCALLWQGHQGAPLQRVALRAGQGYELAL